MHIFRTIKEDKVISNKDDCKKYLKPFEKADREHFIVLGLNTKNKVIYREISSIGTLNSSVIHPREIFKTAITKSANTIIIAHNHPSGDTTPSREDKEVTKLIKDAGEIIGIHVLDHIIFSEKNYSNIEV